MVTLKKPIIIFFFLFLLTGCKNDLNQLSNTQNELLDAAYATETLHEEVNDTYEATNDELLAVRETFIEHFRRGNHLNLPDNYQGVYFNDGCFVIQVSDDDHSYYDFLSDYDCVRIETVKYTRKELEELRDIPWKILKDEHGIDVVSNSIDHKNNAIGIEIFDRYTDDEKAKIASYIEDYPVIIKYVNSYQIPI